MLRAIFYKEWLKTRWYYLVAVLLSLGFVGYVLLNFFRAAGLKGIAHLWEVMLLRDAVFVDLLQFVPLVVGLLFAVVQFVPEMQRKCLKLTLHLPCPELRMIGAMLLYGVLLLGALFAVSLGVLFVAFFRRLLLRVTDNGCGIAADALEKINADLKEPFQPGQPRNGRVSIGIYNVNSRLKLNYGDKYGVRIFSEVGVGTTAEIEFPAVMQKPGADSALRLRMKKAEQEDADS